MQPVINCEEKIGKTVGRRKIPASAFAYASDLQATVNSLRLSGIKKGVYRFKTHEEADQWLMDHLIQRPES
jgi:hypothetical protein